MVLSDSMSIEEVPQRLEDYDPMEPILNYIIESSDATVAVTSTADLSAVVEHGISSEGLQEGLSHDRPRVHMTIVDGWQVGSLHDLDGEATDNTSDVDDLLWHVPGDGKVMYESDSWSVDSSARTTERISPLSDKSLNSPARPPSTTSSSTGHRSRGCSISDDDDRMGTGLAESRKEVTRRQRMRLKRGVRIA
ncbi:uncharacterized protein B0H18DRAFT_29292 [Fomitopsis serialis]|uniref:uncharacterized protein n=1 Tax=Fomitopsis serialis TaxID=139415 RepID=UPI0020078D3F|nr:uncharacterized protein B0H18DRAFT_29292 [Neoantrodia serialis]KAH9932550.1 hypothetical protein B0H18DRAFT_29292 [Neoantrodia serialis]